MFVLIETQKSKLSSLLYDIYFVALGNLQKFHKKYQS